MASISAVRKIGKGFILFDNLLIVVGFYIVFPIISIHFINDLEWSGWVVGFALGMRQLLQQMLGIIGGGIADRFGAKPMIVSGMFMRTLSFATMAYADQPWILISACILSALGGAMFDPPRSAVIMKITRTNERGRYFSILMIQDSIGTVLGALLGTWLIHYNFSSLCWAASGLFFIAALSNYFILPAFKTSTGNQTIIKGLTAVVNDRKFVKWVLTLTGYYILSVQVLMMLPMALYHVGKSASVITGMYAIETLLSVFLLYPIVVWSEKRFSLATRMCIGLMLMILGLVFIGFITQTAVMLISISIFYLGSIIVEPARETLNASLAKPNARSSYMGFSRLGLALGGLMGYCGGGSLYDLGKTSGISEMPWILLGAIGLLTLSALYYQFMSPKVMRIKFEN
ncbi:multidrug efflux MFS transporter MdtH [Dickeya sp. CFBP 2040]|uniref:multidrug efflux MFS transporter MdtH n=1 Tax=Dickeya sp. CFBP 2040 TaxID=2718531 RepID=UPI0014462272|nr:multidrug efflux MFS transporter MdtH [Dickeya sp. CFBP 2040]NKI75620.1 multidrug efflux MFS transporter MdtH [Dickeya sp. CFBP 2040]